MKMAWRLMHGAEENYQIIKCVIFNIFYISSPSVRRYFSIINAHW